MYLFFLINEIENLLFYFSIELVLPAFLKIKV